MGEGARVCVAARDHGGGAVRKAHVGGTRSKRHLAADDPRSAHLGAGGTHHVVEASALEIAGRDRADAIAVASISIYVVYICVGNIHRTVEATVAIVPASPPGVEDLERRQGTPAHVAKTEPDTKPTTSEPKETDQRGRPIVARGDQTGVPAPSVAVVEPASIVIGSPAPGVGADPGPAVPILVNPTAGLVRSPVGVNGGSPYVAILRHVAPGAGGIQIFRAVHSLADVARAFGLGDSAVAVVAPAVPIVHPAGGHHLELGIGGATVRREGLAAADPLRAMGGKHLDISVAGGHFSLTCFVDGDAKTSLPGRTDRK